jgi:hypothetical protein
MPRKITYSTEEIISALKSKKGMVYLAAASIGCDPDTIYYRAKKNKAIASVMRSERGKVVDTGELKLFAAMKKGAPWAVQFALRTLGKDRGYVERQELTGADGKKMEPLVILKGDDDTSEKE